jgi:probable rRNA maturation factor
MSGTRRPNRAKVRQTPGTDSEIHLSLSVQTGDSAGVWPVDRSQLRRWVKAALQADAQLTLRLVGRREGRTLNLTWRGKDYATNVLTFAYGGEPLQADIVLCLPVLKSEARTQRKSLRAHLAHLVVHGVLHAQGHDHETDAEARRMEALETRLLARFRIADPYALVHTAGSATP